MHLYSQGFKDEALVDFTIELNNPSTIAEQEKLAIWEQKIGLAEGFKQGRMVSQEWIYENIFKMTPDEWREQKDKVIDDVKRNFRFGQIEMEGNDVAVTKQSFGTPHDMMALQMQGMPGAPQPDPKHVEIDPSAQDGDDYTIGGRPNEFGHGEGSYGTDGHVRGRDPLGFGTLKKDFKNPDLSAGSLNPLKRSVRHEAVNKIIQNMPSKKEILSETYDNKVKEYNDKGGLLDEDNLLEEESSGK